MAKVALKTVEKPLKKKTSRKAKTSGKSKSSQPRPYPLIREIITLSLGALSIFIFFILFLYNRPEFIGTWGAGLAETLTIIFGLSCFLLSPVFLGLAYLTWAKKFSAKLILGGLIFFIDITFLAELFFHMGGILGRYGVAFISTYLGIFGTGLLLITAGIINFIVLTGIRLGKIFSLVFRLWLFFMVIGKDFVESIFYVEVDEDGEEDDYEELDRVEKRPVKIEKKDKFNTEFREALMESKKTKRVKEEEKSESPVVEPAGEEVSPPECHEETFSAPEEPEVIKSEVKPVEFLKTPTLKDIEETFDPEACKDRAEEDMAELDTEEKDDDYPDEWEEEESVEEDSLSEGEEYLSQSDEEEILSSPRKLELPEMSLLLELEPVEEPEPSEDNGEVSLLLEDTLASFGVKAKVVHQEKGPSITRYELQPAKGVRVNKITSLSDDIALALAAHSVRLEAPIPGKSAIGIEIPNKKPKNVYFGEILSNPKFLKNPSKLAMALGKDITGGPVVGDLSKMPHLLIAGATGAGKSVCLNSIIASILFKARPDEVHFAMIDPKRVELSVYKTIPHLVSINRENRVVVNPAEASELLDSVVREMDERYKLLAENRVRNIGEFNALDPSGIKLPVSREEEEVEHLVGIESKFPMPYIVVIIDELADLMMVAPGEVEKSICRLAQLARAVGIHLVVATQRPSVNVITGIIKANIPARISFAVSSQIDSRTILDMAGAEKLIGRGDMLYLPSGALKPRRVQGAYISLEAIEKLVDFWEKQSPPENITDFRVEMKKQDGPKDAGDLEDELLIDAIDIVLNTKSASVSHLQRTLRVGHARAGRLIDIMEKLGIVGPWEGSKARRIIVTVNPFKREPEVCCDETDF